MQLRQVHKTDEWEERANKVLYHFDYTYPDEIDMFDICWRYGIRIMPLDVPFVDELLDYETIKELKSFSFPKLNGKRGTIYLKEGLSAIEKKLLLAEEFCHMHTHFASQLTMDKHCIAKTESQAKKMSAYLLMPEHLLSLVYDAAYDEAVMISDIADHFLVTEEFAHYRMELIFNRRVDALVVHKGSLGTIEWFE